MPQAAAAPIMLLGESGNRTSDASLTTSARRLMTRDCPTRDAEGRSTAIVICRNLVTPRPGAETLATREKEGKRSGMLARCRTSGSTSRCGAAAPPRFSIRQGGLAILGLLTKRPTVFLRGGREGMTAWGQKSGQVTSAVRQHKQSTY